MPSFAKNISLLKILVFVILKTFLGNFLKILKIVVETRVRRQSLRRDLNFFFKNTLNMTKLGERLKIA